jgi:hypothetical protein
MSQQGIERVKGQLGTLHNVPLVIFQNEVVSYRLSTAWRKSNGKGIAVAFAGSPHDERSWLFFDQKLIRLVPLEVREMPISFTSLQNNFSVITSEYSTGHNCLFFSSDRFWLGIYRARLVQRLDLP